MKKFMLRSGMFLSVFATTAYAASETSSEDLSGATLLFLGFLALVIALQFIPGIMLFCSMIRGLFTKAVEPKALPVQGSDQGESE